MEALEEFYISHNGVKRIEGLEGNVRALFASKFDLSYTAYAYYQPKLRVLDVGNNFITDVENISHLSNLEEFWVRHLVTSS